jgi:hypothetical protein
MQLPLLLILLLTSGLYYKHITTVNEAPRVIRMTIVTPQLGASLNIVIDDTSRAKVRPNKTFFGAGFTNDHHLQSSKYYMVHAKRCVKANGRNLNVIWTKFSSPS